MHQLKQLYLALKLIVKPKIISFESAVHQVRGAVGTGGLLPP
jgi:hypothetical protein